MNPAPEPVRESVLGRRGTKARNLGRENPQVANFVVVSRLPFHLEESYM
jgi:hypothetical protein